MHQLLATLIEFLAISVVAALVFLLIYKAIRLFHRSEKWILPTIGCLLLLLVLERALPVLIYRPGQYALAAFSLSSTVGLVAVVGALYALGQFVTRKSYLLVKKRLHSWGAISLNNILRILRSFHPFLGWSVLIVAAIHALLYIPWLLAPPSHTGMPSGASLISGSITWGILTVLVGLGTLVEKAIRQKRIASRWRLIHAATSFVFFLTMIIHIGIR
ncbi:hypothetical protein [Dictyobacter formicarum]|uniref:Ferric oxidoreductase domain-containing protein n=1 Tax=Dictyobacter formicarum TaxID=2778368 RepID=A0ABQ3VJX4_9CHLR|nr:hypothetical protein [Dictyobacter formicarum]GHO86477.1 hypothetical protein KSZ_44830 [Dictyobacter formicarum]